MALATLEPVSTARLTAQAAPGHQNAQSGPSRWAGVARQEVYEVFARRGAQDPLTHVGSVNAASDELALTYARALYAEDAPYEQMAVVQRTHIRSVDKPRVR